jgi:hypothetical protein
MALWLAIPPGYASPLYPSAGIALACVLTFGPRVLPGVALGAFTVNSLVAVDHGALDLTSMVLLPAVIAAAAVIQAALGAALVRRFASQPLTLSEPRDIAIFFGFGALAACLSSASIGTAALYFLAHQPADSLWFTWCVWALGDTVGVLVAGPMVLTLIGQPRSEWAARRLTVGLSLAVATALMALGVKQVGKWVDARVVSAFERDAFNASSNLMAQLEFPLHALEALRGIYIGSDDVTQAELQRATAAWLAPGGQLQAMGWAEFVSRAELPAFEARARATDYPDFRVFDRLDSGFKPQADEAMAVIRVIEPLQGNKAALGVNTRSVAEARAAIDRALRTDTPAATAGFRATQSNTSDQLAVPKLHAAPPPRQSTSSHFRTFAISSSFSVCRSMKWFLTDC